MKSRYEELKEKLYRLGDLSLGSIQKRMLSCGDPDCKCARGEKHGPYYYFTYTDPETGEPAQISLQESEVRELRKRIENYRDFKEDLKELLDLEVELRKG
ncbi:hypothetical protein AKJ40_05005 [candidate division MSBL1 archaeon SCGC-AAA259M10]|uniref:DUF6788 domain-containing protein n=1 Tax=candidate division MSBL1 archaeon SCGC-AAA259M10 TaxID=1698270 RepID=A0A133UUS6_9EURY|nr:hypothetical protein AKJ40_05005 [candidate division MSBL1 archaeon SCGC-AAA259M10]